MRPRNVILFILAGALLCSTGLAQSTAGTITGIVTDASGAVIPGVEITLTNTDTGVVNKTQTNQAGVYIATSLLSGPYRVEAQAQGFKRKEIRDLTLQTGQELRVDITLELGAVTEAIEVQATVAPLQQETAEISDVFTSNEIQNIPVNGRSPYLLLDLSAGLSAVGDDPSSPNYSDRVSINGSRSRGNNFVVDGATTTHIGGIGERVGSIEAISEFKLYSHTYSAEFGRTAGGIVSFQIRSGTQKYRGSLFEYHRNSAFNANSWANNARGIKAVTRQRNEFGGTLGGPIPLMKQKMFFFTSYEGTRDAQPITRTSSIPDPAMRGGNFSTFPVVVNDPGSRAPFPGNVIPPSRLDPVAVKYMTLFPAPNTAGNFNARFGISTNNWVRATSSKDSGNYIIARLDYNPTSHDKIFWTFSNVSEGPRDQGRDFLSPLNTTLGPRYRDMRRTTLGYTRVVRPNMTMELLASGQRDPRAIEPWYKEFDPVKELGIARRLVLGPPIISLAGLSSYGDSERQKWIHQPVSLSDAFTWLKGRHSVKFGAQLYQNQFWYISTGDVAGTYSFNGEITGLGSAGRNNPVNSVADFLLGAVKTANAPVAQIPVNRLNYNLGLFINDNWKVTRRLTLNLGLRYEFELRQIVKNNVYSRIDPADGQLLVAGRNATRNLNLQNDFVNFAPRLGVAYLLNEKTVIRSGFAVFYSNFWMDNGEMVAYPGWTTSKTFVDLGVGRAQPFLLREGLPVEQVTIVPDPLEMFRAATQQTPLPVASPSYDSRANLPRNIQWNFGIQRSIPFRTTLEVSYVASKGTDLPRSASGNSPTLDKAPLLVIDRLPTQQVRPYPRIANFNVVHYDGSSIYNSLQVKAVRRFHSGFSLNLAYTFSKNIDTATGVNDTFQIPWQFPEIERALSGLDRPHALSLGWVWDLPFGRRGWFFRDNRLVGAILGGFQFNGTFRAGNGLPRTIVQNTNNLVLANQRPDVVDPTNLSARVETPTYEFAARRWLMPFASANFPFVASSNLGIGNLGRNTTRMPGYQNFNLSLFRDFKITERARFQLRMEAYNAINHVNFQSVSSLNINSANFGLITSAAPARQVQIGGRISF
jgi:hypothetical protein